MCRVSALSPVNFISWSCTRGGVMMNGLGESQDYDADQFDTIVLRDDDDRLSVDWIEEFRQRLADGDIEELNLLLDSLHSSDIGDVLEAISLEERVGLINLLGDAFDYTALTEVDESVRTELIELLPNADVARGVADIENDDAVFILEDLDAPDREDILAKIPAFERLSLERSLDFPEESAGRRMQTVFIAIAPFWSVGQTIDYMRADNDLPDEFYQIYVVDPSFSLVGILPLDKLLRSGRSVKVEDIMTSQAIQVEATQDQEEVALLFQRYDLVEVAVVDDSERLVGVLTVDDIVDVINEEADEDIRALAGIGDEDISDNVFEAVKSRVTWLFVNLVTAILASLVISMFDATIQQLVALAVLMPIVASMGGNAGTQTMTLTVRALSTKDLDRFNIRRLISREFLVGAVNGVIFALIMGAISAVWFSSPALGGIIGAAMVINMIAAGLSGILIPLALNKVGVDPAVASSAFVTTVTDVVGFFSFLGFAAMWMGSL